MLFCTFLIFCHFIQDFAKSESYETLFGARILLPTLLLLYVPCCYFSFIFLIHGRSTIILLLMLLSVITVSSLHCTTEFLTLVKLNVVLCFVACCITFKVLMWENLDHNCKDHKDVTYKAI